MSGLSTGLVDQHVWSSNKSGRATTCLVEQHVWLLAQSVYHSAMSWLSSKTCECDHVAQNRTKHFTLQHSSLAGTTRPKKQKSKTGDLKSVSVQPRTPKKSYICVDSYVFSCLKHVCRFIPSCALQAPRSGAAHSCACTCMEPVIWHHISADCESASPYLSWDCRFELLRSW